MFSRPSSSSRPSPTRRFVEANFSTENWRRPCEQIQTAIGRFGVCNLKAAQSSRDLQSLETQKRERNQNIRLRAQKAIANRTILPLEIQQKKMCQTTGQLASFSANWPPRRRLFACRLDGREFRRHYAMARAAVAVFLR